MGFRVEPTGIFEDVGCHDLIVIVDFSFFRGCSRERSH
jgi:hypothetical protein